MKNRLPRSLIILAVFTSVVTLFVIGILIFSSFNPAPQTSKITPSPTSSLPKISPGVKRIFQEPSEEYTRSVREIEQKNSDFFTHEKRVGALLLKLPYQGQYFTMAYSYAKNSYIATISSLNKDLGEKELDNFLLNNDVERSWIRRLEINYK